MAFNGRRHLAVATVGLLVALPAAAQSPSRFDVSAGYQFMNVSGDHYPRGWYVDFAQALNPWLAFIEQVDGSYRPATKIPLFFGLTLTQDHKVHEILVGLRVRARPAAAVIPFGQVLIGSGGRLEAASSGQFGFALAVIGGGANVRLTDRIGVRVRADYGVVFGVGAGADHTFRTFRANVGLNVPFGAL